MGLAQQRFNRHTAQNTDAPRPMALVIDIQSVARMEPADARHYLDYLAGTLERLRQDDIPVTWVTIGPQARLCEPEGAAGTRDLAQLVDMGFYGLEDDNAQGAILTDFLSKYGPRRNEAVFCKSFKSALIEPADVAGKPDYRAALSLEAGCSFDDALPPGRNLPDYLRDQKVGRTLIMGGMSSHCVAETAVSAALKGFAPVVLTDNVLSWQGTEERVDPKTSTQVWRGNAPAGVSWNRFHQDKVQMRIDAIAADPARAFSGPEKQRIALIGMAAGADALHAPQAAATGWQKGFNF
jgi:nicotinamidase-related amidase